MPESNQYYTDLDSKEAKEIETAFVKEYNARAKIIKRAWDYYNGDHDKPLKRQKDGYNDNVIINQVESLTERITGFLLGDGLSFDASGDDETTPTDDDIAALWVANNGMIIQENIVTSGAIEGHCAVRLSPPGEFDEWPTVSRIKQTHFTAFWNPFDMKEVLWYRLQAMGRRIDYVKGVLIDGKVDHSQAGWLEFVYQFKETDGDIFGGSSARWELVQFEDRPNPLPWDYEWPPIIDWQNLPAPNDYYGRSDIKSAIELNDALNFIYSNTQRIIKHHADPKTVGTGFTADQLIASQVGGFYTVQNSEAKIYNLEMQSDGALVQWLANVLVAGLWESGGMVDPATMKDRVGQLTNFGLRVLFSNAIQKTEKKRLLYGEAFVKICKRGLELAGRTVPETVKVNWPDVLPEDDTVEVETLGQELDRKVISVKTYRQRRGYDDEVETQRIADEGNGNGNVGASILGILGQNRPFNRGE